MLYLLELIGKVFDKICRLLNIAIIFRTQKGIKGFNNMRTSPVILPVSSEGEILLEAGMLYLFTDSLKDQYTLIGKSIYDSPHYDVMNRINNGQAITHSDYFERRRNGTLDGLRVMYMGAKKEEEFINDFLYSARIINEGNEIAPIKVFHIGDKYYIYDGKHRAALCALFSKKVRCVVLNSAMLVQNNWRYGLMSMEKDSYNKHIQVRNNILKENLHIYN